MTLESAARLCTASDHDAAPLLRIVMDIAEGERKARLAEAALARTWEAFGPPGSRGREMGEPS